MRMLIRRVLLGAACLSCLLAGAGAPLTVSAGGGDTVVLSTPSPDLTIETITWTPEIPTIGQTVTFTVTVNNLGEAPAEPSSLALYINDARLDSEDIGGLAPGGTTAITFTWTAEAGAQIVRAVADIEGIIGESDETNNEASFALSVLAPDLIIQEITSSPDDPSVGDLVTITVIVKNHGYLMARPSKLELEIDGNGMGTRDVPRLEPDETDTIVYTWKAQSGPHTFRAVADVLNQVEEGDEENNDYTIPYATTAPDLVITAITWSPSSPSVDDEVTFTAYVKNQGIGMAEYSHVAFHINDKYLESVYVGQLNPGGTTSVTFSWIAETGAYSAGATADANSRIDESDETNNEKTVDLPFLAPDLIVQGITWSPSNPVNGHSVTFTIIVENQGKTPIGISRLNFYTDDFKKYKKDVPPLDVNETAEISIWLTAYAGTHTFRAVIDEDDYIEEGNESNNTCTVTATFSGTISPPDLIVQEIAWSPVNPEIGDTVTFTVTVKNQGGGQAGASYIAYSIDDTYLSTDYVKPLLPGETADIIFTWTAEAGTRAFKVLADPNDNLNESNDDNNEKTASITTAAPDLIIENISWSPEVPSTGDTVTFTVTVKNRGTTVAGISFITYFIDGSPRGKHPVPSLEGGAEAMTTFSFTAQAASHTLKAVLDLDNQVPEGDENNNERPATFPAPDLFIEDIAWSPPVPTSGDTVIFTVTVKNRGIGQAALFNIVYYIDDTRLDTGDINTVAPGNTATGTFTWTAEAGTHVFKALADGDNSLGESDEYNNEMTINLSVLAPPATSTVAPAAVPGNTPGSTTASPQTEATDDSGKLVSKIITDDKPSSTPSPEEDSTPNWLFILIIAGVGAIALASLIILRMRQKKR
ncbi:CARDB domain-containing protein [Chloroflexota bacterium]